MIKVEINQKDLSHVMACLANLETLVTKTLHNSIPEDSAREFSLLLKTNLVSQKYAGGYPALKGWKKDEPNAGKFWQWYGDALASIKYYKMNGDSWFAGFGGGRTSAGGKTTVKTTSANATLVKKSGVLLRKPGQTTQEALANRKALIAQRVAVLKNERRSDHVASSVKVYTREEIARENAKRGFTTAKESRSITLNKYSAHEPAKRRDTQHN